MLQPAFTLVSKPNNSLSTTGRVLVFSFIALVSLGIALAFLWMGAWPVVPFAGLELIGLAWAFCRINAQVNDYERLTVNEKALTLEICSNHHCHVYEFNRYWAQVVSDNCRLVLRSHGSELAVGRFLDCEGRRALAGKLKTLLGA